jgi:hypothetical protein
MQMMVIFLLLFIGLLASVFTWKSSIFFLSRKDHYVNSPYELLKKKITMAATAFFSPVMIYVLFFTKEKTPSHDLTKSMKTIYELPDINSKVLFKGDILTTINDSTDYFYNVTFLQNDSSAVGYILK